MNLPMPQDYKVLFEISYGVSHGFGVVYDANSTEEKILHAENDLDALIKSQEQAEYFSKKFLANTNGYKTVEVTLKDSKGNEINQKELMRQEVERKNPNYNKENFEEALNFLFPEGKLTIKRTWIEDYVEIKKHDFVIE